MFGTRCSPFQHIQECTTIVLTFGLLLTILTTLDKLRCYKTFFISVQYTVIVLRNNMGNICASCCKESGTYEDLTPDLETKRRQQVEAAERRLAQQEHRGIKNIESVKRQQRLDEARESRQEAGIGQNQGNLKWQVS